MKPDLKPYQHANASIFKEILENKESRCFVQAVSQWKLYSTQKKEGVLQCQTTLCKENSGQGKTHIQWRKNILTVARKRVREAWIGMGLECLDTWEKKVNSPFSGSLTNPNQIQIMHPSRHLRQQLCRLPIWRLAGRNWRPPAYLQQASCCHRYQGKRQSHQQRKRGLLRWPT